MAAEPLFSLMIRAGVNRVFIVPSVLQALLPAPGSAAVVSRLSCVTVSASVVPHSLRERVAKLTPGMMVLFACAEKGILTSTWGMPGAWLRDTVGRPVPYGELDIVDRGGRSLAPGEVGELRVRSDAVVSGYYDDPLADERFFRNGWFHPGDLACWSPDGQMLFKGRADDMMICHGVNIFPVEIENCLLEHPGVAEAIAFPLPSRVNGDTPAAAVRVRAEVSEAELLGFCRERLGMRHPRRVLIVDDFPRNAMGKPLKREMANVVAQSSK
jgi:fatty-acyl-CoA synthase